MEGVCEFRPGRARPGRPLYHMPAVLSIGKNAQKKLGVAHHPVGFDLSMTVLNGIESEYLESELPFLACFPCVLRSGNEYQFKSTCVDSFIPKKD